MTGEELLDRVAERAKPYHRRKDLAAWPSLKNPLHVALLLIDFDTELTMDGLLGFLENSTGAYLDQTIDAFALVQASQTANTLRRVRDVMRALSHKRLDYLDEIHRIQKSFYVYDQSLEPPWDLLEIYLEQHADEVLSEIERATQQLM